MFSDLISSYVEPYKKRLTGSPSDAREYAALIDFFAKIALCFLSAYSMRTNVKIKIGGTPGFGEMLSGIKASKKWSCGADQVLSSWKNFSGAILDKLGGNIENGEAFKAIRDRLSHGHPLPEEDASALRIFSALKNLSDEIEVITYGHFDKFGYEINDDGTVLSICGEDRQVISPVIEFNSALQAIGIYSSFQVDGVYYLCPTMGIYCNSLPSNTDNFRRNFLSKDPDQQLYGKFVYELTRDIASFSEDQSTPHHAFGEDGDSGVIFITWTKPSSEGNENRIDQFRIGRDNRSEWFDLRLQQWVGYSDFLRLIANWKILARRVRMELENEYRKIDQSAISSGAGATHQIKGPVNLIDESDKSPLNLVERVSKASVPLKTFTTVFFVVGDAGSGKTELLLSSALNQAKSIEQQPDSQEPLLIYISSAGRALSNMEDAVNSALSATRILNNNSAKALCRNGLITLVVDGFDELLGSAGYENPLGSLASWFRDLRGRGVIVASARSVYYMKRYRGALSRRTDLNVDHIVANIEPWKKEQASLFLVKLGVKQDALKSLTERDWLLLSIPFFARAFARWHAEHGHANMDSPSIFEIVVNQYLARESKKLLDQNGVPILSVPQLQALFAEFADMMHMDGERELAQGELEFCAEMAFDVDNLDKVNLGLRRRLTSLCGLSVEGLVDESKFQFSHDVIFDCFLSLALQRRAKIMDADVLRKFFEAADIHPTVMEWFVMKDVNRASEMLDLLVSSVASSSLTWRVNVGALWASVLNARNGIPPRTFVDSLILRKIALAKTGWQAIKFRNCVIEHLEISNSNCMIDLEDSKVNYIEVDADESLRQLRNVSPEKINAISSCSAYIDTTSEIRSHLESLGVIRKSPDSVDNEWSDAANYFINSLVERPDSPIVVYADDYSVDDGLLGWTKKLGAKKWVQFIQALIRNDLAKLERINSSGAAKCRLVFEISAAEIDSRAMDNEAIRQFWAGE